MGEQWLALQKKRRTKDVVQSPVFLEVGALYDVLCGMEKGGVR